MTSTGGRGARGTARNLDRDTVLAERLETAASLWGKFMGLMGRRSLPPGDGLWLPASNGIHMMFMRFPIDAVFVSRCEAGARVGPGPGLRVGRRTWGAARALRPQGPANLGGDRAARARRRRGA